MSDQLEIPSTLSPVKISLTFFYFDFDQPKINKKINLTKQIDINLNYKLYHRHHKPIFSLKLFR